MGCETCYSWGETDTEYFREQADAVFDKLEGEEDIAFSIVAVDSKTRCVEAADEIEPDDRDAFIENCMGAETSVSLTSGGQEFIIVKADKEFLRDDPAALRGLIAHELMHTVQRDSGIEDEVEAVARAYEDEMVSALTGSGLSKARINRFIHTVFQTAIFALKDVHANAALIEQSFTADLEAYYHHVLGLDEFCPAPGFDRSDADVADVQDALTFELGILPAWLPFLAMDRDEAGTIRERLSECYEDDLPAVQDYIRDLADLYGDTYADNPDRFRERFFEQLVEQSIDLMQDVQPDQ